MKKPILFSITLLFIIIGTVSAQNAVLVNPRRTPIDFRVDFDIDVPGARIYIDGTAVSAGNLRLPRGDYELLIISEGYREYRGRITVNGDRLIRVGMIPKSANLNLILPESAADGLRVYLDGRLIYPERGNPERYERGWIENDFPIQPGVRRVTLGYYGLLISREIEVDPGEQVEIRPLFDLEIRKQPAQQTEQVRNYSY
jgi:hypothetical protein